MTTRSLILGQYRDFSPRASVVAACEEKPGRRRTCTHCVGCIHRLSMHASCALRPANRPSGLHYQKFRQCWVMLSRRSRDDRADSSASCERRAGVNTRSGFENNFISRLNMLKSSSGSFDPLVWCRRVVIRPIRTVFLEKSLSLLQQLFLSHTHGSGHLQSF